MKLWYPFNKLLKFYKKHKFNILMGGRLSGKSYFVEQLNEKYGKKNKNE